MKRRPISNRRCPVCYSMVRLFPDGLTLRTHKYTYDTICPASKKLFSKVKKAAKTLPT